MTIRNDASRGGALDAVVDGPPIVAAPDVRLDRDLLALIRPRLATLGLAIVVLSYVIARPEDADVRRFVVLLIGSALALCGSSVLNQVVEWRRDALMRRTANRPIATGRISPWAGGMYGGVLAAAGVTLLWGVEPLAAWAAVGGILSYVGVYTPLKVRTPLATIVGAAPGALPVLMGWAVARGRIDLAGWTLFAILFIWQLPHFLAIAWMYRADYVRAGFRILPEGDDEGRFVARQIVSSTTALVFASLLPLTVGMVTPLYAVVASGLGAAFLAATIAFARDRSGRNARRVLKASVIYLPLLFAALALLRV
ncbi:MAG: heme o synthase [Ardenticatenales bacterium]